MGTVAFHEFVYLRLINKKASDRTLLSQTFLILHFYKLSLFIPMIEGTRAWYNESFTEEKYIKYHHRIQKEIGEEAHFRLSETPLFIPKDFEKKLLKACDELIDYITRPGFNSFSEQAIPDHLKFANDPGYSPILIFDFGVCINDRGELLPQLIEMQGFPSLFGFTIFQSQILQEVFEIPERFHSFIHTTREQHLKDLGKILLHGHDPKNVILLDHKPEEQKTKIDFAATKKLFDIDAVCVTHLKLDGKNIYYEKDGARQYVSRIYNRLIFDEFLDQKIEAIDLRQDLNVEWAPHPNWFCRVSKYLLPYIQSEYVPQTTKISDLKSIPSDLDQYVLKPLYSYAGMGVKIDVTRKDIESVTEPDQWILQKKVMYHPAIETPSVPAKAEIRMMAIWDSADQRPRVVHNLARMSKGKMIGVRYNAEYDWVGSSICFFEN